MRRVYFPNDASIHWKDNAQNSTPKGVEKGKMLFTPHPMNNSKFGLTIDCQKLNYGLIEETRSHYRKFCNFLY